jgi:hypothetical protein
MLACMPLMVACGENDGAVGGTLVVTVHRPDIFIDAWQWDPRQPGSREGGGRPWRAASQASVT